MKLFTGVIILLTVFCFSAAAASNDEQQKEDPVQTAGKDQNGITSITSDRDNDGSIDYVLQFDENGTKVYEELDFNYDGKMDDFYFYNGGVLSKREIDTNYDENVDVWVYIHEGIYIERYERDLDFDGTVDQVKDFSETAAKNEKK